MDDCDEAEDNRDDFLTDESLLLIGGKEWDSDKLLFILILFIGLDGEVLFFELRPPTLAMCKLEKKISFSASRGSRWRRNSGR